MNAIEFVNSIYLGDRGCKKIIFDGWSNEICIQVDIISRVRSDDGNWNFYSDEDIEDGYIVFSNVQKFTWSDSGKIPNDYINYLEAAKTDDGFFIFTLSIDSVDPDGSNFEVILRITAEGTYLTDPRKPEVRITD